jgi:integrase/recombinase XerD
VFVPVLVFEGGRPSPGCRISLGHPWLDEYLVFVAARARWNTVLAVAYDLKVAFTVLGKDPEQVVVRDVLSFIEAQRAPRRGGNVVRLAHGESGLSARTIKRRLASLSGLFAFLVACDRVAANPVPSGLAARRPGARGVPLIRTPRTLRPAPPAPDSPRCRRFVGRRVPPPFSASERCCARRSPTPPASS